MQDSQRISGKKALVLLEQAQQDGNLVTMVVFGKDYERMTVITGVRCENDVVYLAIDKPDGFEETVVRVEPWKMHFEFTGRDRLHYVFETFGGNILGDEILVRLPEYLERIQRRKRFRLEVPLGTRMHIVLDSISHEMTVIDLSESGALVCDKEKGKSRPIVQADRLLKELTLAFPSNEKEQRVNIKEAVVRRSKRDPITSLYQYSLEFVQIAGNEAKTLAHLIRQFERKHLRKRQLLDN